MPGWNVGFSMRHLFLADWFTKLSSGSIAKTVFFRGDLKIGNRPVGPLTLSVPALAVVNAADDVARLDSLKPFIDTMPTRDAQVIEYPGEIGVCLQHLGTLIGRKAHAQMWPEIIAWINARR